MRQIKAYTETKNEIIDPREMERRVFMRITDQLRMAEQEAGRTELFHQAVLENRRLWAAVASDISDPSNRLSKSGLLSLAIWVERESSAVHTGNAEITGLIEVNEAVIAGLGASC